MLNLNKVVLCGRLTADPVANISSNGKAWTRFTVAVNYGEGNAEFINCVAWEATAAFLAKYFKKGSPVYVEGNISNSSYTDDKGNKRYSTDVVARHIQFVESKKSADGPGDDGAPVGPEMSDLVPEEETSF